MSRLIARERERERELPRNTNIELLRIVCIFSIMAYHFAIQPGWAFDAKNVSFNRVYLQALCMGGKLGVNCFLLISGYFLINKDKRSAISIIKIWAQVLTYSVCIPLCFVLFGTEGFSLTNMARMFSPVLSQTWSFASAYIVLMLFVPYVNRFLVSLDKKTYQQLLKLFFICWCLVPTITGRSFESNYLIWMIVMYAVGGYCKQFPSARLENKRLAVLGVLLSFAVYLLSVVFMDVLGTRIAFFSVPEREIRFCEMRMLPCVAMSIFLFLLFKNLKIKTNQLINWLASGVFGVYLIHEHPLMKSFVWDMLFHITSYSDSKLLVVYSIFVITVVFLACEIIESLRRILIEAPFLRALKKVYLPLGFERKRGE